MYRRVQNFRWALWLGEKSKNFRGRKNRFPRRTLKPKFSIFRRRRPDALLTDRGHGGFAFFAHRHCPATQGSTFSARSARRVREKSIRSWPQISNRAKGSSFLHIALAQRRRVRYFGSERAKVECGEYDRLEFYGTDQLERGPRFEAPFQKCVRLTRFKFCQSATNRHRGSEFWHGWPKGSTFSCLFPTRRRL